MTEASFWIIDGNYYAFRISGHSGYAQEGEDIVCSAVSAMTMLAINTILDFFGTKAEIKRNDKNASISFELKQPDTASYGLLKSFCNELKSIENDYPGNVKVTEIQTVKK